MQDASQPPAPPTTASPAVQATPRPPRRTIWRHLAGTAAIVVLVFGLRWLFALEFAMAFVMGIFLTMILLVLGLLLVGKQSRASTAVRQSTMVTAVMAVLFLSFLAPLGPERGRILDGVPVPPDGKLVHEGSTGFLCVHLCHDSRGYSYEGSIKDVFIAQRNLIADTNWGIYEYSGFFSEVDCWEEWEQCSLMARQGRVHLSIQVRNDPAGGTALSISTMAF